jgi:hypothetical protein
VVFRSRSGAGSIPRQDLGDGAAADLVPQIGECALDAPISQAAVLIRQPHDQCLNLRRGPRSSWASLLAAVVLPGDQAAVPDQQRFGRDDRAQFDQHLPAEPFRLDGQSAALVVSEAQPLVAELFTQDPILFSKVIDEAQLAAVQPARQRDQNESERVQGAGHTR